MSNYIHDLRQLTQESVENIPEISLASLLQLEALGYDFESDIDMIDEAFIEAPKSVENVKANLDDLKDLKNQWKRVADRFTMHKWIYRYIKDDKQDEMLHKYYDLMTSDDISYGQYKKCYKFFCNFFGIPNQGTIIEWIEFGTDEKDKEQKKISIRYSRGIARVNIPDNMKLLHQSPAADIKELIPSFRSKTKGKFFYPNNRVYFTVDKEINPFRFGLGNQKNKNLAKYTAINKVLSAKDQKELGKYTPEKHIPEAYIDPTYAIFKERSVYVETEKPIPVVKYMKKFLDILKREEG